MSEWSAIVLAAGKGTRMKSRVPKVLHPVAGKAMVLHVVDALRGALMQRVVVVVGYEGDMVRQALGDTLEYVEQAEQLGTGHAVQQARALLREQANQVLVINGDVPLVRAETLKALMARHVEAGATISLLTAEVEEPDGLGRILRGESGGVAGIVEEKEADASQRAIHEINAGIYCFRGDWLWTAAANLRRVESGEFYLTDLVGLACESGQCVEGVPAPDGDEMLGVNTRVHLARAEAVLQRRIREQLMLGGVTLVDPATVFVDATVTVGQDTVVLPNTHLNGATVIGCECQVGPNSIIKDSRIGDRCRITCSVIEEAELEGSVDVGPFSHIRSGSYLETGVHIGNFGEVKMSRIGKHSRMGHFSYIGDAEIGANVNIGAGTITCNYDGIEKHRTVVEDDAFIGSDSMLVAPVRIGKRAVTGAGSVVNKDVPTDMVAVGVPVHLRKKKARGS